MTPLPSADAMRRAAVKLHEESTAIPAPCGCKPSVRCDQHCRVKVRPVGRTLGRLTWEAICTGTWWGDYGLHVHYSIGPLPHQWATEHVASHRLRRSTT